MKAQTPRSRIWSRALILVAIAAVIAGYFIFDLGRFLSLAEIKTRQAAFQSMFEEHPATVIGIYFAIYVLVTALSLPGATIMTLAGGALFGLVLGTIVVSFASTTGATLAFLASRFLLRDFVQSKFGDRLRTINEGIKRDGAFYLFTLRLIPAF